MASVYNLFVTDKISKSANLSDKRMAKEQVRKLITKILREGGAIRFTDYAEKRMLERGITSVTVVNVLERGLVSDGEEYVFENSTQWRYRVETTRYRVVTAFDVENEILIINAIDFRPYLSGNAIPAKKGNK